MLEVMRFPVAAVAALLVVPGLVSAQPAPSAPTAWIAVPAADATTADAFVEVANPTMYEIYVPGASAERLAEPPAAAGAGAPHLRLVGLKKPLAGGDTVALTLTPDGGASLKVAAQVRRP